MTRAQAAAGWVVMVLSGALFAQTAATFDVASVKRTNGAPGVPPFAFVQSGRFRAPYSTVRELIQAAYGVEPNQVVGGPDWADRDHFDINATMPPGAAPASAPALLRRLLADRFGLVTREEQRELPVHFLTRGEKLGAGISPARAECKPLKSPPGIPSPPPPPPPPAGAGPMVALNMPPGSKCGNVMFGGFFSMRAVPMVTLVTHLSRQIKRPIIDQTELSGSYDIDLFFLPDTGPMMFNGTAINSDAPSLQTAMREQLGLRLDSGRAPIPVVVIERVSPPTEN